MKTLPLAACIALLGTAATAAEPEYRAIRMEIDIARPAAEVWSKVGKYCDIQQWLNVDCKITAGNGDMGTVRVLAGGRVAEILVAQTALSYGYTQPAKMGEFYNLYHGFMEALPVTAKSSKMIYTLLLDVSDKPDAAAKDADVARRRASFEKALQTMKTIAETP